MREVRAGTSEKEFNEQVVAHLKGMFPNAYETETGGGISCVVVPHENYEFYFGTANELWGADVYRNGEFQDGQGIETDCATTTGDPLAVAQALARAVNLRKKRRMTMGMQLHSRVKNSELTDDQRFDFLKGLAPEVARLDEVHGSADDDSCYVFLIWLKPDRDEVKFLAKLRKNIAAESDDWGFKICANGVGFVTIYTWLQS